MAQTIDSFYCPLCEKKNNCQIDSNEPCWCKDETFPEALLAQVPKDKKRLACICQACVKKFNLELGRELK